MGRDSERARERAEKVAACFSTRERKKKRETERKEGGEGMRMSKHPHFAAVILPSFVSVNNKMIFQNPDGPLKTASVNIR